jgi:hypothetical protein
MGRREDLSLRERQEIIFREHKREHIRVASRELPWVSPPKKTTNPVRVASLVPLALINPRP